MKIYDRQKRQYIEAGQYGQGKLEFLYGSAVGRLLLKPVISPFASRLYGFYNSLPVSAGRIPAFVEKYHIPLGVYEKTTYRSFNEFFTRKRRAEALHIDRDADSLIAPADAKLLVYRVTDGLKVSVKGRDYTLGELTDNRLDMSGYGGGLCLVFRLCMEDYHRYCFIDSGRLTRHFRVKGRLHTVSSVSKDYPIFKENSREISVCETARFGEIIQIEVGALLVGRIVNHGKTSFGKGEEKGWFEPGGSTIVLLLRRDVAVIDRDITEQSDAGIETVVCYGERIGKRIHD